MNEIALIESRIDKEATAKLHVRERYVKALSSRNYQLSKEARKQLEAFISELNETHDVRRYYDGRDLRWVAFPKGVAGEGVNITCYRKTETWLSRNNAMSFYAEGVNCCEGSEQERYIRIFMQLGEGCTDCSDEL